MTAQPDNNTPRRTGRAIALRVTAGVAFAGMLAAAFPPVEAPELAWVAFLPLLLLAACSSPRTAFRWGWASGLLFWLLSLSWLLRLMQTGGMAPGVLLAWILLAAYCALYTGAFTYLASHAFAAVGLAPRRATRDTERPAAAVRGTPETLRRLGLLVVLPLLWVGFEYLRATLFTGFAWNAAGISQYRNLAVIQIAAWGGVYAVSFVILTVNTAFALSACRFIEHHRSRKRIGRIIELTFGLAVCMAALFVGATQRRTFVRAPAGPAVRIAAVNPAIPQVRKWDDEHARSIEEQLTDLTQQALIGAPDLVVWPETAVPYALRYEPATQAFVGQLAREGTPILVGSIDMEDDGIRRRYYNSAFLVDASGAIAAEYRKQHLVPFGEYFPFDRHIALLERLSPLGYSCTPGTTGTVFRIPTRNGDEIPFAVLICFEDTVAGLARKAVRNGARLLVNQTNDAWFENTAAARQHLAHCVFRCVETRVPAVRCVNVGITCFIDRTGAIDTMTLDMMERGDAEAGGYRTDQVLLPPAGSAQSVYTRHGDWPFAWPCGIGAGAALLLTMRRDRRAAGRARAAGEEEREEGTDHD